MLVYVDKNKLKEIRLKKGISCYKLSLDSGLGKNAVKLIESGECNKSSYIRIKAIAKQLGVAPNELVVSEN